jgi:hypothetical protein
MTSTPTPGPGIAATVPDNPYMDRFDNIDRALLQILYAVTGGNTVATPTPGPVVTPAPVPGAFNPTFYDPTPVQQAAFAARFGIKAEDLTGDNAAQTAVTATDPELGLPWPTIQSLGASPNLNAVEEYAGYSFRPDGSHAPCSKRLMGKWLNAARLIAAAPTADAANRVLDGAGACDPYAVILSLMTGLVTFPTFSSPTGGGAYATTDAVIAALTAIPTPSVSPAAGTPGVSGR